MPKIIVACAIDEIGDGGGYYRSNQQDCLQGG